MPVIHLDYILRCKECGKTAFQIDIGSPDPYDIQGFTCLNCKTNWLFTDEFLRGDYYGKTHCD